MHHYPNYYSSLEHSFQKVYPAFEDIIMKDVRRTANCINDSIRFNQVKRILLAFAKRNPEIGYLQGFNFMVDFLLGTGLVEEEVFWVLVFMIEDLFHPQFYSSFFPLFADIKFFKCMIYHLNYKIFKRITSKNFDLFFILHKWFLLHFMDAPNKRFVLWLIDFLLIDREIATLKAAAVIFTRKPKEFRKCETLEDIREHLDQIIVSFEDEAEFKSIFKKFFISKELFTYARELLIKKEKGGFIGIVGISYLCIYC